MVSSGHASPLICDLTVVSQAAARGSPAPSFRRSDRLGCLGRTDVEADPSSSSGLPDASITVLDFLSHRQHLFGEEFAGYRDTETPLAELQGAKS